MEFEPIGLETFDRALVENELRKGFKRHPELLPDGGGWLLVEFGGESREEAEEKAVGFAQAVKGGEVGHHRGLKVYSDAKEIAEVWEIREGGVGNSKVPGEHAGWPSWEDAAVPPERTGDYLRDLQALCEKHGRKISCFFGHIGHGCVHTRIDWDFLTAEGIRNYRAFMEDAGDLIASYGGSLSGEHGDGQARAELLPKMFKGPELIEGFRQFKRIWDPDGRMNPGKMVDPFPLDTNLQMDPSYHSHQVRTAFAFPGDGGSFAAAAERCFGVGACRDQGGVMCPSYQVTFEEKHSTRGRARLLFEMMRAESPLGDPWRNEEVKAALDLCLACKGCLHECPVRVDMATYKAEFFSHYYHGRLRPLHAYALGLIRWEAELASHMPRLANTLLQVEPFASLGKRLIGVAQERRPPRFAEQTFKHWFRANRPVLPLLDPAQVGHAPQRQRPGRVVLFADTFSDYFHPEVAIAATEVLEAAGFEVVVPQASLCCGRPLYDYGMLGLARRQLHGILDVLRGEIQAGTPVVALEPSCGAVLRHELTDMLPHDEFAKRLSRQTLSLGEFLAQHADGWEAPRLERRALVHFHCHQRATSDVDCDRAVLDRLGLDYDVLDDGCCGLAGSFGYEAGEHYEVSIKAGERKLLPAAREAADHTLLITDGFSCRSQIEHGSPRSSLHLSQVLQMALQDGPNGPSSVHPEDRYRSANGKPDRQRQSAAVGVAAGLTGAALLGALASRRASS